jgi:hypothetical protein
MLGFKIHIIFHRKRGAEFARFPLPPRKIRELRKALKPKAKAPAKRGLCMSGILMS